MSKTSIVRAACVLCAIAAMTRHSSAQFTIEHEDVFQDQSGFSLGPGYAGPVLPASSLSPFKTIDFRGVVADGGFDAYDFAGIPVMEPPARGIPVQISRRVDTLDSINVFRWIDTFTNPTDAPMTLSLGLWTNLGSDGSDFVAHQDPFRFVSFENGLSDDVTPTDAVVAMMHGNNQWAQSNIALQRFNEPRGGSGFGPDDVVRAFTLTLAPEQSVSLMFADFLAYSPTDFGDGFFGDPGQPADVELAISRTAQLLADPSPLFADLPRGQGAPNIINWTIPAPAGIALAAFGLPALLRRRR